MRFRYPILLPLLAAAQLLPRSAKAATLVLTPAADAVLYEDPAGAQANGAGEFLFAGRTNQASNQRRRSVLRFDLSSLPAGAVVTSASIQLHMVAVITADVNVDLHRVTSGWTAGPANPASFEGNGVAAAAGDTTWLFASYNTLTWSQPGGDAAPAASASTLIGALEGYYTWSTPGMVSDVQAWQTAPAANFGWMLRTDELVAQTAKRFDSGDSLTPALRPQLTLEYTIVPEPSLGALTATGALLLLRRRR